nr:C10 family peptidase [Pseudarcicella sp.]
KKVEISNALKQPIDTADHYYKLWKDVGSDSCSLKIEFSKPRLSKTKNNPSERRRNTLNRPTIYPLKTIDLHWGQGTGYNYYSPGYPWTDNAAGCPAVAIGMLNYYHFFPYKYNYYYMPNTLEISENVFFNGPNQIAEMFRDIADSIPNYVWGSQYSGGSGAIPEDILTGIKRLGYKNAIFSDYNIETVYNNLLNHRPVLLAGFRNYGGGHIWFCDGFYEAKFTITKTTNYLFWCSVEKWDEYEDFLYMNWGWDGKENNWFAASDFKEYGIQKKMFTDLYPVY